MEEERRGIGSILRSQPQRPKTAASLRLRRSADIFCSSRYSWSLSSEGQDKGEGEGNVGGKVIGGKSDKIADDSSKSWSASFSFNRKKSLEVCTEHLGSETGSEGFLSDDPPTKASHSKKKPAQENEKAHQVSSPSIPPASQSFPRQEGPSFLLRSHRRDGCLVIEAVPFFYFKAERQCGRLLLSLIEKPYLQN